LPKGTSGSQPSLSWRAGAKLVKGLFADSLPPFLARTEGRVLLAHIDCDLYSSAKTVLTLLRPRLETGTVLAFDEYFNYPGWEAGEHRALVEFAEFAEENGRSFEYLAYNRFGEQVVVRLG
jgi:hypothetical protein